MVKTLLAALVLWASASTADAALIYLKDGGTIEGDLLSSTSQLHQIRTRDGQTVTVGVEQVERIDYQADAPKPPPPMAPPRRYEERVEEYRSRNPFDRSQEFSFELGLGVPLSRVSFKAAGGGSAPNGSLGFLGGVQYLGYTSSRLGLGAAVDFFGRSPAGSGSLLPYADAAVSGRSLLMLAVARYTLTDRGATRPYLLLGAGAHHTSTSIDASPKFGFTWSDTSTAETRSLVDDQHWGPAGMVRFGVDFDYAQQHLISFEIGWIGFDSPHYDATTQGQDLGIERVAGLKGALTFGGRWGWRF